MTRNNVQSFYVSCVDSIFYVGMVNDTFVKRTIHLLDIHAQTAGGIRLRIGINH